MTRVGAILRFSSAREACLFVLQNERSVTGHPLPLTPAELARRLQEYDFFLHPADAGALLRELATEGQVLEVDESAGYRWSAAAYGGRPGGACPEAGKKENLDGGEACP